MSKLEWPIYCSILYYLREEYYGTALTICDKELGKSSDLPQIVIFRSIALVKYGQFAEALRLLELVRQDSNIAFAASVVLRAAHILANDPDREAIRELDRCISKEWSSTNMEAHYNAVIAYTLLNNYDKAHALTEKYLAADTNNVQYIVIRAFLEYHLGKDANIAEKLFEKGIAEGYPCAYIGMARLLEARRDLTKSRQLLHDLIEKIPTFVPGQIELSKIFLMDRDWRQCIEQVQRTLLLENDCLQVRLLELVYEIVVNGETKMVENNLQDLFEIIEKNEPKNHKLHHEISTLLIRITTSDHGAVEYARKLLDRAISIKKDTEYLADKVRLLLQAEDISLAQKVALEAVEIGAAPNEQVLMGIAQCFMAEGRLDDAAAQMNFVKATYPDISQTSLYMYLTAVQTKEEHKPFERFFEEIKGAVDAHLLALQGAVFGLEYLKMLDPNFLIDVVWQLYDFAPLTLTNATNGILKEIERILALIYDCCPGLLIAKYLLAKAKYLSMDFNEAERLLKNCIDKENTPLEAYLLIAQVYIHKNNYDEAGRCLNIGLSYNFKVREHPLYHLIRAKLQKKSKQIDASIQTLLKAIELPLFKAEQPQKREKLGLMDSDRIAIYLELMDSYQQNGQLVEADGVMNDARSRWAGKSEQQQFVLMEANLKLQRRDINGALAVLASVQPSETNYQAARIKMAEIYLNEKKDKQQFAICFKQLAQNNPTPMAYILLGDAYMNIQEPAKAIEVYESALKSNPKDDALAEKIGQAYVQCHLYTKAVSYYEAALKSGRKPLMRMRLAELLFDLGKFEKCEKVLRQALDTDQNPGDITRMKDYVSYWSLLSKLHFETGNWQEAIVDLARALEIQMRVITKLPSEVGNFVEERKLAAKICCQLAEMHWSRRDANKAIEFYKEALALNNTDIKTMTALANIYLSLDKLDACNAQCQLILNIERNNDDATLMIADLLYQSNEADKATVHFTQLLDRNPNQYHALARCIELSWRRGDVEQAEKYLKKALETNPRATIDAGFNYCKGLHEWYTGEPNEALQAFNRARRDLEWGERAIYNIIEICLNPDNEIIGGEIFDYNQEGNINDETCREVGAKAAERFLKELHHKPGLDYKFRLMENFIMLASNNREKVQQALTNFLEMAGAENSEVLSVGALLGTARAYLILKQAPKAKSQLKRVINFTWTLEDADYLEKCWLLLVDLYINQGKNDQATAILRTVLRHNSSSIKAFEYMGYLREKEQKWIDAAANYEEAWRLSRRKNPSIGYKLAYNYLKCRKLFECIDVCHRVLELYPDYPRIKREIMDKARANIRT